MTNSPLKILQANINTSVDKASRPLHKTALLAVMAGAYIAIGAIASTFFLSNFDNFGMAKFMQALAFTIGIVSVILSGGELFTGNILLVAGFLDKKISLSKMLENWIKVYIFNLVGALIIVFIVYFSKNMPEATLTKLMELGTKKVNIPFFEALIMGIGCNILVCLSVWTAGAADAAIGKFFLSAFPVFIFIILGYEHCVANMFYIPMAMILGADVSIGAFLTSLIPVTIGNIIGGSLIGGPYYFAFRKDL